MPAIIHPESVIFPCSIEETFRIIILPVVLYGCEAWSLIMEEKIEWECSKKGCCEGHLACRGKLETAENCMMMSFMISTLHQVLLLHTYSMEQSPSW